MIDIPEHIRCRPRHPYIYAILKGYCLYIGETLHHPAIRWGQHLTPQGSFMQRLKEADEELWASNDKVLFICIACNEIADLSGEEQKQVSRYVEHKVHERCILNKPEIYPVESIISDTLRTAPARCRYSWANTLAEVIFQEIKFKIQAVVTSVKDEG